MGNHEVDHLRYQNQTIEKVHRPLPRVPPQQHKVIEILPKPPLSTVEWRVPDQTLGIPVISPSPSLSHLHSLPAQSRSTYNYAMHPTHIPPIPMHTAPMIYHPKPIPLLKSKSMYNIPANVPQVIHQHPLVSGHIPPTTHYIDNYTIKKNATASNIAGINKMHRPPSLNAPSILSSPSTQPNVSPKKENGEKNKVKFSDTVTVAVVPVSILYIPIGNASATKWLMEIYRTQTEIFIT